MRRLGQIIGLVALLAAAGSGDAQITVEGAGSSGRAHSGPVTCVGTGLQFNVACNSQYMPIGMTM